MKPKEKIIKFLFVLMLIVIPTNVIVSRFIFELLLSEIFVAIFILTVLIFYYKSIFSIVKKHKNFLMLSFLFIFSLFLSSALSIAPRFSLIKWFEFYFSGLLFAISFLLLLENGFTKIYFLKTVVRVGMFYSVMGIIEALLHNKILGFLKMVRIPPSIGDYPKIAGIFEWHTVFGSVMAFNSVISLILFIEKKITGKEFIISEILFITGIILSTSRNAFIILFLGIVLILMFNKRIIKTLNKKKLILYSGTMLVFIILLLLIYSPARLSVNSFLSLFKRETSIIKRLDIVGSGRVTILKLSIDAFLKRPIMGIGIRMFPFYSNGYLHTHNIFFQFLTEGGIVGVLLFLCLVFYVLKMGIKNRLKYEIILFILFLFNQSFGYFVGHIYYFVFYMWFTISLIIYEKKI